MTAASRRTFFGGRTLWAFAGFALLFLVLSESSAQPAKRFRPSPIYGGQGHPDQNKGRALLEKFRGLGIAGDYYLEFDLRVMPRRGEDYVVPGRLWGGRNALGPISRVVLLPVEAGREERLLVQSGPQSRLWSWNEEKPEEIAAKDSAGLFVPLAGTQLTPFDLQMPFLYWDDFIYEGIVRLRGRPADTFLLYPPPEIAAQRPELTGVRVYLDSQYDALVQAEEIGPEGRSLKAIAVLELQKIDNQWIVKTIDLRDEVTRDKTRFSVTGAALALDFTGGLLEPSSLRESVSPPASDRLRRIAP